MLKPLPFWLNGKCLVSPMNSGRCSGVRVAASYVPERSVTGGLAASALTACASTSDNVNTEAVIPGSFFIIGSGHINFTNRISS